MTSKVEMAFEGSKTEVHVESRDEMKRHKAMNQGYNADLKG